MPQATMQQQKNNKITLKNFNFVQNSKRYFILLLICGFLFTNCHWIKKQPDTPEEVLLKFIRAIEKWDIDLAMTYCDSTTSRLFEQFRTAANGMSEDMRNEVLVKMKLVQTATCDIRGNVATCRLCCDEQGRNVPETISLRLDNNQWLIALGTNAEVESTPPSVGETEPVIEEFTPPTEETEPPAEETEPPTVSNEED